VGKGSRRPSNPGLPVFPGTIIAGKYRVGDLLGEGGMGFVVAATHSELKTKFAIKLLREEELARKDAVRRFSREAQAVSQLKSEHVARVYDVGKLKSGVPFIVMEHLEGSDLRAVLERDGPMSVGEAARYLIQVCEALAEAHSIGIVHRDLKPSNLFLVAERGGSRRIKVLDFGISKMTGPAALGEDGSITATDAMLGSPAYMSPEQIWDTKGVDARTDIWSAGVILYELVTGSSPFKGVNAGQTLARVREICPEPPSKQNPAVPAELDDVILRCLKKEPTERYADVAKLARALLPFASDDARPLVERAERMFAQAPSVPDGPASAPRDSRRPSSEELGDTLRPDTATWENPKWEAGAAHPRRTRMMTRLMPLVLSCGALTAGVAVYLRSRGDAGRVEDPLAEVTAPLGAASIRGLMRQPGSSELLGERPPGAPDGNEGIEVDEQAARHAERASGGKDPQPVTRPQPSRVRKDPVGAPLQNPGGQVQSPRASLDGQSTRESPQKDRVGVPSPSPAGAPSTGGAPAGASREKEQANGEQAERPGRGDPAGVSAAAKPFEPDWDKHK
jgi:serine/threonine-protein kinase